MKIPGLGALKFHAYTRPLDAIDRWLGARRLPAVAHSVRFLGPLPSPPADDSLLPAVNFLTGGRFLYQTIFSAYSLIKTAGPHVRLRIVNDDTLTPDDQAFLQQLFPGRIQYERPEHQRDRIETLFPTHRFPELRRARQECALFRKLLDVHGGAHGWNLFIDSDTFFHRPPTLLLQLLREGGRPCFMYDRWSNYGHPTGYLQTLTGAPLIERVNSGLVGLRSESIDWERLEHWLAEMIRRGGHFVFFEQGLTAMLLSLADPVALPSADYVIAPSRRETARPTGVFHHYAGDGKYRFLRYNVPRRLLAA